MLMILWVAAVALTGVSQHHLFEILLIINVVLAPIIFIIYRIYDSYCVQKEIENKLKENEYTDCVWFLMFFPYTIITVLILTQLWNLLNDILEDIGANIAKDDTEKLIEKQAKKDSKRSQKTEDKYRQLLQEAHANATKYLRSLFATKLTPDGKFILFAVQDSLKNVKYIIDNISENKITIEVFAKAFELIKTSRAEMQKVEKLAADELETAIEEEIKIMKKLIEGSK